MVLNITLHRNCNTLWSITVIKMYFRVRENIVTDVEGSYVCVCANIKCRCHFVDFL